MPDSILFCLPSKMKYTRLDVGKKGIDSAPDIGQLYVKNTKIVSPPPAKIQKVECVGSKNKESTDNLLVAESITETKEDVGDRDTASAPEAEPAQNEGAATGSQHPAGVPGDKKAEAMDILNYDDLLVVKSSMECESSLSY
ncbi:hypothetical protein EB796_019518 [Bugula neritina]|uniref:Uncharacterized protein n=1 Tax=Bugula neritina TaxID=10212 RepID=A0A7J7J8Y4_BUGNE|nr:hypothetical protein EB796_019518 [Bugula neritina]